MNDSIDSFQVIGEDDHGQPVHDSGCPREVKRGVVLPLAHRSELEQRPRASESEELWMGLCAYRVLAMAKALARAEGKL